MRYYVVTVKLCVMKGCRSLTGWVYIVCLCPSYKHAKHYIGFALDVRERFRQHRIGRGARLLAVAVAAGCSLKFFIVKRGTRLDERRLKNEAHSERHCPLCKRGKHKP